MLTDDYHCYTINNHLIVYGLFRFFPYYVTEHPAGVTGLHIFLSPSWYFNYLFLFYRSVFALLLWYISYILCSFDFEHCLLSPYACHRGKAKTNVLNMIFKNIEYFFRWIPWNIFLQESLIATLCHNFVS